MKAKMKESSKISVNDLRKIMNLDGYIVFKYLDCKPHEVNVSNYQEFSWVKNSGLFEFIEESKTLKNFLENVLNHEKVYFNDEELCYRSENILDSYDLFISAELDTKYLFKIINYDQMEELKHMTMGFENDFFNQKIKSIKLLGSARISVEV